MRFFSFCSRWRKAVMSREGGMKMKTKMKMKMKRKRKMKMKMKMT